MSIGAKPSTPCVEWDGFRDRKGYGKRHFEGRHWLVHRLTWTLANGPIPDGINVCHACDNPACYRLDHLWLGTAADNTADMVAKGRHKPNTKLSRREADAIRALRGKGLLQREVAVVFNVSQPTVSLIWNEHIWPVAA